MTDRSLDELGPVDYVIVEFPAGKQDFTGEGIREMVRLHDAGTIRVMDILILQKGLDDFEYLAVLQQRLEDRAKRDGLPDPPTYARDEMRKMAGTIVKDIGSYNLDTILLQQTRDEIAKRIEAAH